jgi:carbon-monoxide dehydrogenase medium subunit
MVLMALDAVIHSLGPKGARVIPADQFFLSIYTTALEPDEVLTEIRIPLMKPGVGYALEEFSRRKGDFAIVGIAALVDRSVGQGQARLVACGVSGAPVRLLAAEAAFSKGPGAPAERAMRAAACAADEIEPMHSPSVTIAYRRQLTQALTERALIRAMRKTEEYVKP